MTKKTKAAEKAHTLPAIKPVEDYGFNDIAEYNTTNAVLAELKNRYAEIPDCTTEEGYEFVKQGLKLLVSTRNKVDKARKEKTKSLREIVETINSEGNRIMQAISEIEGPMAEAKTRIDEEEKRKKEERENRLRAKMAEMDSFISAAKDMEAADIESLIADVQAIDCRDFFEFEGEALKRRADIISEITQIMMQKREQEAAEKAAAEAQALLKKEQAKAEVDRKINHFKLVVADMIGESSEKIEAELEHLGSIEIDESVYGDRTQEAQEALGNAIKKLGVMAQQQKQLESIQPEEPAEEVPEQSGDADEEISFDDIRADLDNPQPEKIEKPENQTFEEEDHDIKRLTTTVEYLRQIKIPEMKTARGQQIRLNALSALSNMSDKLEKSIKDI